MDWAKWGAIGLGALILFGAASRGRKGRY